MDILKGQEAISYFLKVYSSDILNTFNSGEDAALTIDMSTSKTPRLLRLEEVFLPEIGGDEKTGVVFSVSEVPKETGRTVFVEPGSDLDFLLKWQVTEERDFQKSQIPLTSVYDLRTLITHDDGLYGVNFCWMASLFPIVVQNEKKFTAGHRLYDLLEAIIRNENADAVLAVGERARDYAGVVVDRLRLPFTASRPEGSKIKRDVIKIGCVSSYNVEAEQEGEAKPEEKPHVVDLQFMKTLSGKKIVILDDLDATRNTLNSFEQAVRQYGGLPIAVTVNHLAYLPSGIVVPLGCPVRSIFQENSPGKPVFTQEIKDIYLRKL